jgi:peptide/nickel transport system substrate-binding protein
MSANNMMSRRGALKLGAGAFIGTAALPLMTGYVNAQGATVLKVAHPSFNQDWSPMRGGGAPFRWNSIWWASPMYFDADGKINPYVFESWSGSDDKKVWTFKIAGNAAFSDGSKITAADVKGSWELATMPNTKNQRVSQVLAGVVGYAEVNGGNGKELPGVVAKDDATVEVTLTVSDPIFFMHLGNHIVPIVKASQARGDDGNEKPEFWLPANGGVTSGPFTMTEQDLDGGKFAFDVNPKFFGPAPKISRIEITSIEDAVSATELLTKGEFQAHTELVTSTIVKDLGPEFASGPTIPTSQHFWINSSRAPMEDPKVRQALIMAIDRDGLIKASFPDGPHKKADEVMNSVPGAGGAIEAYKYDPAAAKALLAESTYGGPEKLPKIMFVGISSPANEAAAQYIAEQWRQNLGITTVDMKPQQDQYAGPDQNAIQIFRDDVGTRVPDAASYLAGSIHSSSGNAQGKMGGYKNAEVDALINDALTKAADDPARVELAQKAQAIFMKDYNFIPWYQQTMSRWALANVKGMEKNLDWQVIAPWNIEIA